MKVYLALTTPSPTRAMPVVRTPEGLCLWTSIYNAREPDDLNAIELDEVILLVATGHYHFARTN